MSRIVIQGVGAVSPAGWSAADLLGAIRLGKPLPAATIEFPGRSDGLKVRRVPAASQPFSWMRHGRLRRASPISRFATAAAFEALGNDAAKIGDGSLRPGIVFCVMAGCVNYSSRFYREVLADPATASPLVFPETVFNAPASHLAALLGTSAINYTQVGDDTAFVQGLATAAGWLEEGRVDGCLVIGAEECDWLTSDGMKLFDNREILAEGAGAVYLTRAETGVALEVIASPRSYRAGISRSKASRKVKDELQGVGDASSLFDSISHEPTRLNGEVDAWRSGVPSHRVSLRRVTGNAFCAASAWQLIAAADQVKEQPTNRAFVTVAGCNHAAIGLSVRHV